jgi:hypothetical protein
MTPQFLPKLGGTLNIKDQAGGSAHKEVEPTSNISSVVL